MEYWSVAAMDKKKEIPIVRMRDPLPGNVHIPAGGAPQGPGPSPEIYAAMGEENMFRMCADFYEEIGKSSIRPMFSDDLPQASKAIAAFLVGLCGGPPLFRQRYGEPMMRARHMAFAIDEPARQVWLACFKKVLDDAPRKYNFPPDHLPGFIRFLEDFSAWMVNRK
jgi:hemoglobin